jgi:hypothetical protein
MGGKRTLSLWKVDSATPLGAGISVGVVNRFEQSLEGGAAVDRPSTGDRLPEGVKVVINY